MRGARVQGVVLGALVAFAAGCGGSDDDTAADDASPPASDVSETESGDDRAGDVAEGGDETTDPADGGDDGVDAVDGEVPVGNPVSVVGVEEIRFDGPFAYEVSPDGSYVAAREGDQFCIAAVDDIADGVFEPATSVACDPLAPGAGAVGQWSPDGRRIVYGPDVFRFIDPGEVRVLDLDGTITTVAAPPPSDDERPLDGAPILPLFIDDSTVAFGRTVGDPVTTEVAAVDIGSGDEREIGTVPRQTEDGPWLPQWGWSTRGDDLLVSMAGGDRRVSLWTLDLATGEATELPTPPTVDDEQPVPRWLLHDRVGSTVLVADAERIFAGRDDGGAWWIDDLDDGVDAIELTASPGDGSVRHAVLSPDGATVAVHVVERGPGGETSIQVLTAPTVDVLAGTVEWVGVDLPEDAFGAADLDQSVRALSWRDPEHLLLKGVESLYRFELG